MKIFKNSILLGIIIVFIVLNTLIFKKLKNSLKSKNTPKGTIKNHYGTPNIANVYGPQSDAIAQYIEANPDTFAPMLGAHNRSKLIHSNDFKPYPGYENKMNPSPVKAGEYTNIAPSATHEVNPEITGPKLHVEGEIEYPSAVKVPTFYGFQKEFHPIVAYDKLTGEIFEDQVLLKRPIYNYENRVSNVSRPFNQFYDLRNGQQITIMPKLKKHGIDQVNEDWKPPMKNSKCKK